MKRPESHHRTSQADESITRQFEGLGLGLPIAKRMVNAMHGRIEHERIDDRFTCFRVCLNLPQVEEAQARPTAIAGDEAAQSLHILLAEDDYANRQVLCSMLVAYAPNPERKGDFQ